MNLSPLPIQKFFDNNGIPLVGGKLFTYVAGTNTKTATYQEVTGVSLNTNPIILDFRGECRLWINTSLSYKFVLAPSTDTDPPTNPIWTVDNISTSVVVSDNAAIDTGSVNAIQLSIPRLASTPSMFDRVVWQQSVTNTGATTISLNGGLTKALTWQNKAGISPSTLIAGGMYEAIYDGVDWQLQGPTLNPPELRTSAEIAAGITPVNYAYPADGDFRRFTNVHDGSADITSALVTMNLAYSLIKFPPGTTANIINWVPLTGTKIIAHGALIRRHSDATYSTTTSSDAVVIANPDIEVLGGEWTQGPAATQATWSGAFLIDGGDNFRISHAEIRDTWGGIHGNEVQNGTNLAEGVTVTDCWFHDCQHNNYFADIDGLIFSNNVSEDSDRDGLRTYRNVRNITVTGNILRNNGDGTVGQSQDGIDLFVAGYRTTITGNLIYGNTVKGIDIKRNADFPGEPFQDHQIICTGNIVFSNSDIGISVDVADAVGFVDYVKVHDNIVTANSQRGIFLRFIRYSSVHGNAVFLNLADGIRIDNSTDTTVIGNTVVDNTGVGISTVSTTAYIEHNRVVNTGALQTTGIVASGGVCRNNYVTGHTTQFSLSGTLPVRGKITSMPFSRVTAVQLMSIGEACAISGIEMSTNVAEAGMDVAFSKRNATTGAFSANICNNAAVAFATAFVAVSQAVTGTNSQRNLAGGEMLTLTLANFVTNTWTAGMAKIHYID